MTGRPAITWIIVSLFSALFLALSITAFALGRGDWLAYFQSPARVGMIVVSLILGVAAVFSRSGGMNPGKKEDRRNRWIFAPLMALTLAMVVLPPYLDGRNLWVADAAVTPYVGLALFALGGALRIAPVFVLGRRFTGLVAIQEGHRLVTNGLYGRIRHPSYAGLLLSSAGFVLCVSLLGRPAAGRRHLCHPALPDERGRNLARRGNSARNTHPISGALGVWYRGYTKRVG